MDDDEYLGRQVATMQLRILLWAAYLFAFSSYLWQPEQVRAQDSLQLMLTQNCERLGIDQCYRDGGNRFIRGFIRDLRGTASTQEQKVIDRLDISVVASRDVLMAWALMDNGSPQIRISSAFLYYLHTISYSAVFATLQGIPEADFDRYVATLVTILIENTRRSKVGERLRATESLGDFLGIARETESEVMGSPKAQALTSLFFQAQFLFVLSHEVGHHIFDHVPAPATETPAETREKERQADRYATRALLKLGYSLAPMISGMTYFATIEGLPNPGEAGRRTHPHSACRLADVLEAAINEYRKNPWARDELNREINRIVILNPETPAVIRRLRTVTGSCGN